MIGDALDGAPTLRLRRWQERLGHSSAKMTRDVYTKAIATLQKGAARKMDGILLGYGSTFGAMSETEEV
jgi:integrase